MHDFAPFLYGHVYGVVQPFVDQGGVTHEPGEVWQFLQATPSPLRLHVVGPDAVRRTIDLAADQRDKLGQWLVPVGRLPWQYKPTCACQTPQLQQVLGDQDLVAVVCAACRFTFAAQPIQEQQLQVIAVDEQARNQLFTALEMPGDAQLAEVIGVLLELETPVAMRAISHKLGARPDFGGELGEALRATTTQERLPALLVAERLAVPHVGILSGILHALTEPLDPSPLADEQVLALKAAHTHAEGLLAYRAVIEKAKQAVTDMAGARAALIAHLCDNVLGKMTATVQQAEQAFQNTAQGLADLAIAQGFAAAQAQLETVVPDGELLDLRRGALLEAAGDLIKSTQPAIAAQFWQLSLVHLQRHVAQAPAGTPGTTGELERVAAKAALH